jgi:type II secretory pathway pseudopilin PulG
VMVVALAIVGSLSLSIMFLWQRNKKGDSYATLLEEQLEHNA